MKRIFTIIFVLFIGLCNNYAQEVKALKIGDKVPDVVLAQMLNYKSATANLSEFSGKLQISVILTTHFQFKVSM